MSVGPAHRCSDWTVPCPFSVHAAVIGVILLHQRCLAHINKDGGRRSASESLSGTRSRDFILLFESREDMGNPRVFFDITIDGAKAGRIIMEVNKRTRRAMFSISSHFNS